MSTYPDLTWVGFWYNNSMWGNKTNFDNLDMYDFVKFQTFMQSTDVSASVDLACSPFTISQTLRSVLSDSIYEYCYGKTVNLKDTDRWKRNFLGEIKTFLLEKARYLQAYSRDVNSNIDDDGSKTVQTDGESKQGNSSTRRNGEAENIQGANVTGSDQQGVTHELGDTLTVLNNQTTSTKYLATSNEENYSTGSENATASTGFGKDESNRINYKLENANGLQDSKNTELVTTKAKKSPLEIAQLESQFNFQLFFDDLYHILDTYFLGGDTQYA